MIDIGDYQIVILLWFFIYLAGWLVTDTESYHLETQASLKLTVLIKQSLNWQ